MPNQPCRNKNYGDAIANLYFRDMSPGFVILIFAFALVSH